MSPKKCLFSLAAVAILLLLPGCQTATPAAPEEPAATQPSTGEQTPWQVALENTYEEINAAGFVRPTESYRIGALLITLANPYWVTVQEGWMAAAEDLGIEVVIQTAPTEEDVIGQLETCESMVAAGFDAIVVNTITEHNLVECVIKGSKEGIAMVDPDGRIDIPAVEAGGGTLFQGSTLDYYQQGQMGGQYIVDQLGSEGGKVAIIEGLPGAPQSEDRKNGAKDVFEAAAGVELVTIQAGDWDRTKALDATTNILQANPDLRGIYAANDVMALAAAEAVAAAGKQGQVLIVGTDLIEEAKEAIRDGRLAGSVAFSPYMEGIISAHFALLALQDKPIDKVHIVSVLVTIDNIDEMADWK